MGKSITRRRLMLIKHHCDGCESTYKIVYNEEECEDSPTYCPFCSTYIIEGEIEQDDNY
jgi:hypothetical protein